MTSPSFYVVLELSKAASADDIKAAYRRLAKARHPDKNLNNPNATALFQQLQSAYSTLSDPSLRRSYDEQLRQTERTASNTGPESTSQSNTRPQSWSHTTESVEVRKCKEAYEQQSKVVHGCLWHKNCLADEMSRMQTRMKEREETLARLLKEDAKYERDKAARQAWFAFLWRPTSEQEAEEDRLAAGRKTGMIVVRSQLSTIENEIKEKQRQINEVIAQLAKERMEEAAAKIRYESAVAAAHSREQAELRRRAEKMAQEAEARKRAEAEREWQAYQERCRAEATDRAAAQEMRREAEAQRKREAEAQRQRKAEAQRQRKAEAQRQSETAEEATRRFQNALKEAEAFRKKEEARKKQQRSSSPARPSREGGVEVVLG
ncbi:hypothetical protein S40288_03419 [Stachybotrys chartarum IBT 40288]|nr:hypothetical protein S40288_03419 [Stachybotrys chartarum IBT 40288]